ncbi:hypothetical protein T310_2775 [Rasamsonia emersonii CBS 393.64]|uniref:Myb-like domain-containing protein n=1 Tax=Rasamsonia emersonii (strain ATCC 16479 / CBS 393.64 / IMI 116815) TaxID=1408163 RepID=A0A0F4YY24_RASE3|nr:hypothetical protein T310_2775 [Rasamsonia emersonii CBS 393.64]KKA23182.1 hypothetical protein T310_2775 [Rasamsonia emersonii CBS 393.64]
MSATWTNQNPSGVWHGIYSRENHAPVSVEYLGSGAVDMSKFYETPDGLSRTSMASDHCQIPGKTSSFSNYHPELVHFSPEFPRGHQPWTTSNSLQQSVGFGNEWTPFTNYQLHHHHQQVKVDDSFEEASPYSSQMVKYRSSPDVIHHLVEPFNASSGRCREIDLPMDRDHHHQNDWVDDCLIAYPRDAAGYGLPMVADTPSSSSINAHGYFIRTSALAVDAQQQQQQQQQRLDINPIIISRNSHDDAITRNRARNTKTETQQKTSKKTKSSKSSNKPSSKTTSRTTARDLFLLECKRRGMSYKEIKKIGRFEEAESTLRGRFRTLTKSKEQRVRKPKWEDGDIHLLCEAVRVLSSSSSSTTSSTITSSTTTTSSSEENEGSGAGQIPLLRLRKISWKRVAEYIWQHGGSYHFGNATFFVFFCLMSEE